MYQQTETNGVEYVNGARIAKINMRENPVVIRLTDKEFQTGVTDKDTIQEALRAFYRDGCVILENVISDDKVDKIYEKMCKDNEQRMKKPNLRFNLEKDAKNVTQIPPLTEEFLYKDVYANPHLVHVLSHFLGPYPEIRNISSNVALPGGTKRQAVHSDAFHAFPNFPFGVVVNTYIQDSSAHNGVTEIWLGSPAISKFDQFTVKDNRSEATIKPEVLEARAKISPPVQPTLRKGSMCIRDYRIWHAGMPNHSDARRIMLTAGYFAQWYGNPSILRLPSSLREKVESEWEGLSLAGIEWVDGPFDYLNETFTLNKTQDPTLIRIERNGKFEDKEDRQHI